jgi:drug/metabolite transporter (DMT)-like permease
LGRLRRLDKPYHLGYDMPRLAFLFWFLNMVLDTTGHMAFKRAALVEHDTEWRRWRAMLSTPTIWIGAICFVLQFFVWLALLSLVPLSLAVMLAAIDIVAVMYVGKIIFGERLDRLRVAGVLLITLGVALAGLGA